MKVVFYQKSDGTKPAEDFIKSLPPKMRIKITSVIIILKKYGTKIREPYSKPIGDGIFELRAKVGSDISRVLYFFVFDNKAIITNGFIKKTMKTPRNEIKLAKSYRADYLSREEEATDNERTQF